MAIFRKLWWFFEREKKHYLLGITALIIVALAQLLPPWVIGKVIDEIASKHVHMRNILFYIFLLVMSAIVQYSFRYIWRTNIWGSAARLEKTLRERLFDHFTLMDQIFYHKYRTGDLMAYATMNLTAIQNVAGSGILTFIDSFITGTITIIAMMIFVDIRLTILALLPLPLLSLMAKFLGDRLHDAFRKAQDAFSDLNDKVQESVTGIKVIKTFGQEKEDVQDFKEKVNLVIAKNKKVALFDSLYDPLITLIIGLTYVVTIIIGGGYVVKGTISIGQLVSFMSYIGMLVWPMFAVGQLFNVLERGNASYDRVFELFKEKSHIIEKQTGIAEKARGTIQIDLDEFTYPDGQNPVLQDIHLQIPTGKTLGIVGKTGSGKTTLLSLLLRTYDDYKGSIYFGDYSIKDYRLDAYLPAIGYVPQDHFLFSTTIAENICFANPEYGEEKMIQAAKQAAIHEDILQMPNAYETLVGERGISLSGGQKQRISIARAFITEPNLLILDDALSAVDAKTEEAILEQIRQKENHSSMIIVAHRLSSVMHADEIIVLEDGRIAERGTHQELLANQAWYAKMWHQQQLENDFDQRGAE
ncbi:ABC transporter ATP-binding protein [Enterococcus columbae]|uniref:Multidrug resistance-like ATP-binding protein mdlA n=1 Tax=Enterococcus columbae DSM 7374 = ATCC 51263 TaxID=1121865 RepID=S1N5M6_9ENTE|nr:ABC transporter transmembrane domain-containing protein [Enterococcus columbae]EOT44152.1 multidrug resistance-like ATP-binding protein mdlA [Enterococcus columbae DSM 7374 = ATCC 51263]EOW84310.1 multidrug resistance-like ATP-binding protein mdlA [Enterococcus columbae DSM 7374 = ATCC 51263]OJG26132.1 multidrug resistance-like ATP-binding protein mdlA [Enterococcus columbae DSM 7374 = ATCC 51263]